MDPLAGLRNQINRHELDALVWPDDGTGCPVKVGDTFALRSCAIEITRTHRARAQGKMIWRAEFERLIGDKVTLLDRQGKGYVTDLRATMPTREDPHVTTLCLTEERDLCEPEGVAPHEIATFTGSKQARLRHEYEMTDARLALDAEPLEKRIARVLSAVEAGLPVGRELRAVMGKLAEAERKIGLRRAA